MKILLICPAGMGKTYYIIQQIIRGQISQNWCFIAPLRAIIEEVHEKLIQENIQCLNIQSRKDVKEIKKHSVILTTSNLLSEDVLNYLNVNNFVFVIDEFHLMYRWGPIFREDLNQLYYFILSEAKRFYLLTATFEKTFYSILKDDLNRENKSVYQLDYGNLNIKKNQIRMITYLKCDESNKSKILNLAVNLISQGMRILIFVPFRSEVDNLEKFFSHKSFIVISAKGGEAFEFSQKMQDLREQTQVIIATSVLSHGVNLPPLDHIFLMYEIKKRDFWVQMVYRAGRKGESFYLHHFDQKLVSKLDIIKGFFWNRLLKIQMLINQIYKEFY
ncbi:DEAD/DEAH box helicase [Bacteriovoracaceae bacterium]|nr:DEAD/DEAH box helicase [Bacteriovoracaceae bacterium]